MTTISDIFDIPTQVHQGDFVLRLTEGVTRPADTLRTYVLTPQLEVCFDRALGLIKSALESNTSKGAYLHGSFGSGKSHFMAVLTLLLQHNADARSVPELAAVVAKHNAWSEGRRILVVPYHMIGAVSLESAVLGHYAAYVRALHPQAPTPGFYRAEGLFDDARRLRATMGDATFFGQLGGQQGEDDGWGRLGSGWDAVSFDAALAAAPMSEARIRLVGDLVDAYFQSARALASTGEEGFVALDEGLSIMSKHAQGLGYDAVVLFLDELILWLASHAADHAFLSREGQKVGKLVESMSAERPIPLVSFIARQRDLRELVGDYLPGAEQLGFADVLNWWEARFDEVTLEDRNLPAIVEKRLLRPRSAAAARDLHTAFERTARVREEVMNTLLTRAGDRAMFRQVYPFSPALVQTLVAISSLLQRERTALKLMLQLLVNQRDVLQLGDIVPVGDLFDVIVEGDEPFTQAMRLNFDHAKRLYRQKLLPMLEQEHGVTVQEVNAGTVDAATAQRFRTDDRLLKTLILSALAPEVEALRALTPSRLAALNHGSIRSPIPGQESQIVLHKCRNWAAQVGEIKIAEEGANPAISLHIVGVDTEGILANAQNFDSYGNRIQKARSLLYEQIGLAAEDGGLLPPRYEWLWRGTWRTCEILFRNVRELSLESFRAPQDMWRIVIDFPFDREGYTPADDRAKLQEFSASGESSHCLVWLPSFLTPRGMEDLGRLVLLDHVLSGNALNQYSSHLSQIEREQARALLQNQRDQMRQRLRNTLLVAYGISSMPTDAIDTSHDLNQHFVSLHPALTLQPPVGATFKDALEHLFAQALTQQFPAHPPFDIEVKRAGLRRVLDVMQQAAQARDGRVEVERSQRDEVRRIAVPLLLGNVGETHFVLRDEWKSRFLRKQAEEGMPGLTVRRLRAWMEQPEAMGLPRDIQNLVIMGFALQGNYAFALHGGSIEPRLERLDDALELRQQPLPDEALWQEATQRLSAILGVVASPLLSATTLATWAEAAKREAVRRRPAVAQLCAMLHTRLPLFGIDAHEAPRLQTAQAVLALVSAMTEADDAHIVNVVAGATLATSATAMGQAITQATALVGALDDAPWELFDRMAAMPGESAPPAHAILAQLREALRRDEHVVHLVEALQDARTAAYALLTQRAPEIQTPPAPVPAPVGTPAPTRKRDAVTHAHHGLGSQEARDVLASIDKALAANPDLALDIHWRLYPRDEIAP